MFATLGQCLSVHSRCTLRPLIVVIIRKVLVSMLRKAAKIIQLWVIQYKSIKYVPRGAAAVPWSFGVWRMNAAPQIKECWLWFCVTTKNKKNEQRLEIEQRRRRRRRRVNDGATKELLWNRCWNNRSEPSRVGIWLGADTEMNKK